MIKNVYYYRIEKSARKVYEFFAYKLLQNYKNRSNKIYIILFKFINEITELYTIVYHDCIIDFGEDKNRNFNIIQILSSLYIGLPVNE